MRFQEFQSSQTSDTHRNWSKNSDDDEYRWDVVVAYPASTVSNTMADVVIPSFGSRRAAGELFFNPQHREVCTTSMAPIEYDWTNMDANGDPVAYGHNGQRFYPDVSPYLTGSGDVLSFETMLKNRFLTSKNIAIAEAFANIDVSEAMLLASIGEAPETVKFAIALLKRSTKLVRALKTKRSRLKALKDLKEISPKKYAELVAQSWLEFRYAFRPLVFEMEGILSALSTSLNDNQRFTARGTHQVEATSKEDYDESFSYYSYTGTEEIKTTVTVRAGVMYTIHLQGSGIRELFGLDQPLESLWELVPFSFIVDWFFNCGNLISAWTKNASATVEGSWCTIEVSESKSLQITGMYVNEPYADAFEIDSVTSAGYSTSSALWKWREVAISKPILPSVSVNLNWAKVVDLAIISKQIFLSGTKR